ncbi:S8 family serine peptidase [Nostoc sp. LEGE 12447]|uniref:S8 family serine peptidase n=1 Tax=Nostoc sp. LEGE 12447 TaxID=1828640 RepID=UPI002240084C|nr:S8 family serine peptidase [Nostoc sp. LEGE 12447]
METDLLKLNRTNLETLTNNPETLLSKTFLADSTLSSLANTKTGSMLPSSAQFINQLSAFTQATQVGLILEGNESNNVLTGGNSNDFLLGLGGNDKLTGGDGKDLLIGGDGRDLLVGGLGQDGFVYEASTESLADQPDRIGDFNLTEGDKIQLFDLPNNFYYLGNLTGNSLPNVLSTAYGDKDVITPDKQALQVNEAVMFSWRSRFYVSLNYNSPAFDPQNDLVVDLTGIKGALPNKGLVYEEDFFTTQNPSLLERVSKRWFEQVSEDAYPLIGIIDSGFSASNPDIDYSRLILGSDRIDGDDNPLFIDGYMSDADEHGTRILGIIGAIRNNNIGIDGINDRAPIWLGRALGSGNWAESVIEFVDKAKELGKEDAVLNLSFDLTQINLDGSVTTRYQLTAAERAALDYAERNQVLVVVASGNERSELSALGQATKEFDNVITVGAADGTQRAYYSSYGDGLDILAQGGTPQNPLYSLIDTASYSTYGSSLAAAKVTGAISLAWAANPDLNYTQVLEVIKRSAKDISTLGWDEETGLGLLNIGASVDLAKATDAKPYQSVGISILMEFLNEYQIPESLRTEFISLYNFYDQESSFTASTFQNSFGVIPQERSANIVDDFKNVFNSFINYGKNNLASLDNDFNSWLDYGNRGLGNIRNSINSAIKYGTDYVDDIEAGFNSWLDYGNQGLGNIRGSINSAIKYGNDYVDDIEAGFKSWLKYGGERLNGIEEKLGFVTETGWLEVSNFRNVLTSSVSNGRNTLNTLVNNGSLAVENAQKQISLPGDLLSGGSQLLDVWNKVAILESQGYLKLKTVEGSFSQVEKAGANALDNVRMGINEASQVANQVLNEFANGLNGVNNFSNEVLRTVRANVNNINSSADKLLDEVFDGLNRVNNFANEVLRTVRANVNNINSSADKLLDEVFDGLNRVNNFANEVLDEVVNGINSNIDALPFGIGDALNSFITSINNQFKSFNDSVVRSSNSAFGKARQFNTVVNNAVDSGFGRLETLNSSIVGTANSAFGKARQFNTVVNNAVDSGFGRLETLNSSIVGTANSAFDQFRSLNSSIVEQTKFAFNELDRLNSFVNDSLVTARQELGSFRDYVFNEYSGTVDDWRAQIAGLANRLESKFEEKVVDKIADIWKDDISRFAEEVDDKLTEGNRKLDQFVDFIKENPEVLTGNPLAYVIAHPEELRHAYETVQKVGVAIKEFANKAFSPLIDKALDQLERFNPISNLINQNPLGQIKGFVEDRLNSLSSTIHDVLEKVDKPQTDGANAVLYVLEGDFKEAWNAFSGSSTIQSLLNAGKSVLDGNWEEAGKSFLTAIGVDLPPAIEKAVDRTLKSNKVPKDEIYELLSTSGLSVKTIKAAVEGEKAGFTQDDQIHAIFNILAYPNIPIVSQVALAIDSGYYLSEAVKQFDLGIKDQAIKDLLTGAVSAAKVQNAADWVDAAWALRDVDLNNPGSEKSKGAFERTIGSALEAIDVDNGKKWVSGAFNLADAINGQKDKYDDALSSLVIAAADIDDPTDQKALDTWAQFVFNISEGSSGTVLRQAITTELKKQNSSLDEETVKALTDIALNIKEGKFVEALKAGFSFAGFDDNSTQLADALLSLKSGDYEKTLTGLLAAANAPDAADLINAGKALAKVDFSTIDFDQTKKDALVAILKAVGSGS